MRVHAAVFLCEFSATVRMMATGAIAAHPIPACVPGSASPLAALRQPARHGPASALTPLRNGSASDKLCRSAGVGHEPAGIHRNAVLVELASGAIQLLLQLGN